MTTTESKNERKIEKGKTYVIKSGSFRGEHYWVEGLWNGMEGNRSWIHHAMSGNPACLKYMARREHDGLPPGNDVYYGKFGGWRGDLVHESEIGEEAVKVKEKDDNRML